MNTSIYQLETQNTITIMLGLLTPQNFITLFVANSSTIMPYVRLTLKAAANLNTAILLYSL